MIEVTVQLGKGNIGIGTVCSEDKKLTGINFTDLHKNFTLGETVNGKVEDYPPPFLTIVTSEPESLDVLIRALEKAKTIFKPV